MKTNIRRREFLASLAMPLVAAPVLRGMTIPRIKDVSVIATEPAGVRLVVVKVLTDQDGLYGYGCATIRRFPRTRKAFVSQCPIYVADIFNSVIVKT